MSDLPNELLRQLPPRPELSGGVMHLRNTLQHASVAIPINTRRLLIGSRRAVSGIFKTTIVLSILTFIFTFTQRQLPLLDIKMNHSTKILNIKNNSLAPDSLMIYAMAFIINLGLDKKGLPHISEMRPEQVSIRGFLLKDAMIWPWMSRNIDLKNSRALLFQKSDPKMHERDETLYCLVVEVRSWLSNRRSIDAILTPKTMFAAGLLGPMAADSAFGGSYQSVKARLSLEAEVEQTCLAIYNKVL
jgi:hypothetical protein